MHGDDENDYDDDSEHNNYGNVHYHDGKIRGRAKRGRRIQYIYIYRERESGNDQKLKKIKETYKT